MNYREKADKLFLWALEQPRATADWEKHSRDVARVCEAVAEKAGMDKDLAYAGGLLHDFYKSIQRDSEVLYEVNGRKATMLAHPFRGYEYMMDKGFPEAARICLTHTFYNLDEVYNGGFDERLLPDDKALLVEWLTDNEYDDYDKLVQLADNMASWRGIMSINDRFCDIMSRHPVSDPRSGLNKLYELKDHFDEKINGNIYELFRDEICEATITEPTRKAYK